MELEFAHLSLGINCTDGGTTIRWNPVDLLCSKKNYQLRINRTSHNFSRNSDSYVGIINL